MKKTYIVKDKFGMDKVIDQETLNLLIKEQKNSNLSRGIKK
ncbi:hypothetical protein ACI3ER_11450 [Bacillus sp. Wb]